MVVVVFAANVEDHAETAAAGLVSWFALGAD